MFIAHHAHLSRNSRYRDAAIELRQRTARHPVEPPDARDELHDQQADGIVKNAQRRIAPTRTDFRV